ncbi:hypothetical protein MRB53_021645 [Persea americana]|uniref:Uncharacterized protein n=1 Tax=Persea americana TaxID=3435 RepID=A0ACC2L4Q8_PERAE|nr:hypothetical protein MRB53_021645 [Persea americana]
MGGVQKKNQRSQEIPAWHKRVIRALITLLHIFFPSLPSSFAMDSITPTQSIKDANTILSPDENFALGFFIPPNSTNRYIGIWYNKIPEHKVIWVANRQNPVTNSSGVFTINSNGDLVLLDKQNNTVWFALNASTEIRNSRAKLLDTGNLVLLEHGEERVLWQSFEHPSDTFLSTMKLGESKRLRSWKSLSDPSIGSFSAGVNVAGNLTQTFVWHNSTPLWRTGPWNGRTFTGISSTDSEYFNGFQLVRGDLEGNASGGTYDYFRDSFDSRFELGPSGKLQQVRWDEEKRKYHAVWSAPQGECDLYGKCGPFGVCNHLFTPICRCLHGFRPKAIEEWSIGNWSGGCERRRQLDCNNDTTGGFEYSESNGGFGYSERKVLYSPVDRFLKMRMMKLPDLGEAIDGVDGKGCEYQCFIRCACVAYAFVGGIGCMVWSGYLIDIQEFSSGGEELYIRLPSPQNSKRTKVSSIVVAIMVLVIFIADVWAYYYWLHKSKQNGKQRRGSIMSLLGFLLCIKASNESIDATMLEDGMNQEKGAELFDFAIIETATDKFSNANMLGQGGFGPVYKTTTIPIPKKPAFIDKGSPSITDSLPGHSVYSINYASMTTCDGR